MRPPVFKKEAETPWTLRPASQSPGRQRSQAEWEELWPGEPETLPCLLCLLFNPLSLVSTSTNWKHPALGYKTLGRMRMGLRGLRGRR